MFLTVLCALYSGNTAFVIIMMFVSVTVSAFSLIFKTERSLTAAVFSIVAVISCILVLNTQYRHDKTVSLCGEGRTVEAVITSEPDFSSDNARYYAVARLISIDGERTYGKIRLSFSESGDGINPSEFLTGDRITFCAYVYKIGSLSERVHSSFCAEGIYTGAYSLKDMLIEKPSVRPISYYTNQVNLRINSTLNFAFDDNVAGLLIAMLTGNKDYCTDEVYDSFKLSGAAHLMAVSGLHLSIWISIFGFFLNRFRNIRKLTHIAVMIMVIFITFLADFSPSVCRAALMIFMLLSAGFLSEKADPLNSMGFAMMCILSFNVYAINSISFQLSFASAFSIITVAVPLCNKLSLAVNSTRMHKFIRKPIVTFVSSIVISLTVMLFTVPIGAWHFGYTSSLSPITNLLLIPVCAPLLLLTVLYIIFSGIPLLSDFLFISVDLIGKYMINVSGKIAASPVAALNTGEDTMLLWAVVMISFGFMLLMYRNAQRSFARVTALLLAVFVMFSVFKAANTNADEYKIRIIGEEGRISAMLIYNRTAVLIGARDTYYFAEEAEFVCSGENAKLVALLPDEVSDKRKIEYLCADLKTENVLDKDEGISLFGKITVENKKGYAIIKGNGKTVAIFYDGYLQPEEYCDIIIGNKAVICKDGETVYSDEDLLYGTVRVSGEAKTSIRGEMFWRNLTKKSLKLI